MVRTQTDVVWPVVRNDDRLQPAIAILSCCWCDLCAAVDAIESWGHPSLG